ncbi:MAG: GGDEF domain-containing protein [Alphaproteobacteria bacterium]|jgi:diguanylate cyclase|nr:GGDEF domain-containing protein [Alphaproteobacteria bacterium]MDP6829462.1 GGDEF domain-containing protein [Alphaproteobacteria bacterium]
MASGSQNNNHGQEPDNEDLDDLEATGQVIAAGEKIVESVGRIDEVLETASSDASAYGDALAEFGEKILAEGGEEAQALIAQMLRHTQEMQEQNNLLRDQLAQSSGEIDQLRGDLEEVKREATIDALTTVGNRKYFDVKLREMTETAKESGEPLCLLMFDVDNFKIFNDTHGHQIGDQVLRLVSRTLKECVKGRDIVARYGGEEFAIILSGAVLKNALKVAEDIRAMVAKRRLVRKSSGEIFANITISGGVASYRPGESLNGLIERSDAALYSAKAAGRNKVMAEEIPENIAVNQ